MGNTTSRIRPRGWKAWLCGVAICGAGFGGTAAGAAGATVASAPTIMSVQGGIRSVTVAFAKPASDGGTRISSYRLRCTSNDGGVSGVHQAPHSPIIVTGLSTARSYTCTVVAGNKVGISPASAASTSVKTLPTVPGVPTITSAKAGLRAVTVAFTAPADNGGAPITMYRLVCVSGYGGEIRSQQAPRSPISVACIEANESYTCTVAASNRRGMGTASAPSDQVVTLPSVPDAPTITTAMAGSRHADVAFAAPASDGGARISSYRAVCTSTDGGVAESQQASRSPIRVTGLTATKTYTCIVRAGNQIGFGLASLPSSTVVPLTQ